MSNICIAVLIGIPAAGKSTFCELYKTKCINQERNATIICYDKLCIDFSASARKSVLKDVESFIQTLQTKNSGAKNVIFIDDNMYYKSMRSDYIKLCKLYKIGFIQIYFNIELELALTRNKKRTTNKVPDEIIIDMFKKIEIPSRHVYVIESKYDFSPLTLSELNEKIEYAMKNPLKVVEVFVEVSYSKLQEIDLILRKIVNELVTRDKLQGEKFNIIKKNLFKHIKNGNINLDLTLTEKDLYNFLLKFFTCIC